MKSDFEVETKHLGAELKEKANHREQAGLGTSVFNIFRDLALCRSIIKNKYYSMFFPSLSFPC